MGCMYVYVSLYERERNEEGSGEKWKREREKRIQLQTAKTTADSWSRRGFTTSHVLQWFVKSSERLEEQGLGRVIFCWACTAQPWLWLRSLRSRLQEAIETDKCDHGPQFVTSGKLPFPMWLVLFPGPLCFHCDLYQEMNALYSTCLCFTSTFKLQWMHVSGRS